MSDDDAPLRTCKVCGVAKPLTMQHFQRNRQRGGIYYAYTCKACMNTRAREARAAAKPKQEDDVACKHCGIAYPWSRYYFAQKNGRLYPTCRGCFDAQRRKVRVRMHAANRAPIPCDTCGREYVWNKDYFAVSRGGLTRTCRDCAGRARRCARCGCEYPLTKVYWVEKKKHGKAYYSNICRECRGIVSRSEPIGLPINRSPWRRPTQPITYEWWLKNEAGRV